MKKILIVLLLLLCSCSNPTKLTSELFIKAFHNSELKNIELLYKNDFASAKDIDYLSYKFDLDIVMKDYPDLVSKGLFTKDDVEKFEKEYLTLWENSYKDMDDAMSNISFDKTDTTYANSEIKFRIGCLNNTQKIYLNMYDKHIVSISNDENDMTFYQISADDYQILEKYISDYFQVKVIN